MSTPGYTPPFVPQSVPDPNEILAGIFDFNLPEDIFETYGNGAGARTPTDYGYSTPTGGGGIFGPITPSPGPGGILQNPSNPLPSMNWWTDYDTIKLLAGNWIIWIAILAMVVIGTQAVISGDPRLQKVVSDNLPIPIPK
jgi:hypothetical protein